MSTLERGKAVQLFKIIGQRSSCRFHRCGWRDSIIRIIRDPSDSGLPKLGIRIRSGYRGAEPKAQERPNVAQSISWRRQTTAGAGIVDGGWNRRSYSAREPGTPSQHSLVVVFDSATSCCHVDFNAQFIVALDLETWIVTVSTGFRWIWKTPHRFQKSEL